MKDEAILGIEAENEGECGELVDEALTEQQFPLGELLREDARRELAEREPDWGAFQAQLFLRLDSEATAEERQSLEDRAIAAFKAEVEAEVAHKAPAFEGNFRHGVELRIWQAAKTQPSLFERARARLGRFLERERVRWSLATAGALTAAAAALFLVQTPPPPQPTAVLEQVSLDRLSFEGTATVMSEGGVTVLWLTDGSAPEES